MIVSFTGTQQGMTENQKAEANRLLVSLQASQVVHGDCIGADEDMHDIASEMGLTLRVRPCTIISKRAYVSGAEFTADPEPPLDRNRKIVDDGHVLIATPNSVEEKLRSGTWATIRYARKKSRTIYIIPPDGQTRIENA